MIKYCGRFGKGKTLGMLEKKGYKIKASKKDKLVYALIVLLGVIAFVVSTLLFMKLEEAEAAQNVQATLDGQTNTYSVPDVSDWDWSSWLATEKAQRYSSPELIKDDIQNNFAYMIVLYRSDINTYMYYFGKSPLQIYCTSVYENYQYQPFGSVHNRLKEDYKVNVSMANGVPVVSHVEGLENNYSYTTTTHEEMFYRVRNMYLIGSNYDMFAGYEGTYALQVKLNVAYNNIEHPVDDNFTGFYDPELPYIKYDSHFNINRVMVDYEYPLDESVFILNYGFSDPDYVGEHKHRLESVFYIWLPSPSYIQERYNYYVDEYLSGGILSGGNILFGSKKKELQKQINADILAWQKKVGTDNTSVLYETKRTNWFPPIISEYEEAFIWDHDYMDFHDILEDIEISFADIYGFKDKGWEVFARNLVFGHMYIYRVDNVLFEERPRGDFYNGITTFSFLVNGECVESRVVGNVLDDDGLNDIIDSGISQGMKDYMDKLNGDINDLQNQLNSITSVQGAFDGNLDNTDLWTSFKSLGDGLTGLVPALQSVANVTGTVFSFIPAPVQNIMAFTFVALCVIALIKAIRG